MRKRITYLLFALLGASGLKAQITTYPHFTDFESEATCGTSCTTPCNQSGSWKNGDQYGFTQAGTDWLTWAGATPSASTGPDIDHTLGTSGGKYVYVETSGCTNVTAHLVSPVYDFSALLAPKLRFWYHLYGATMGTMSVDVDTSGVGNWVLNVSGPWTDNVNIWQLRNVDLTAFAGKSNVRIRLRSNTGTSFTSDMGIDDIEVYEPLPYDFDAVSVTAGGGCGNSANTPVYLTFLNAGTDTILVGDTATLGFTANGNTYYDTLVFATNFYAGDTMTYTFVNGFADLSGPTNVTIVSWTSYAGDVSYGNDTVSTVTIGIPIISTYPYKEDFESGQNGWVINNGSAGTWAFGTPAKTVIIGASSGANCFVTGGLTGDYNNSDLSYVEGPCFDLSNICDPVIELRVWWNAEFSWDGMNITASTDGGTTWNLVGAFGDPFNWYTDNSITGAPGGSQSGWSGRASTSNGSNGWVTAKHRLNGLGNQANVKIRVNFGSDGSVIDDGVAFDDVRIYNGVDLGDDVTICAPTTLNPDANNGNGSATYLWSTGATTSSISISQSGTYSVSLTADVGCTVVDSYYVAAIDTNTTIDLGPDTLACTSSWMLDAGYWPGSTYAWSTGDSTQMINFTGSGNVSVMVTTTCGILLDSVNLSLQAPPTVDAGNDVQGCDSVALNATISSGTILWSNGSTTVSTSAQSSGTYWVMATDSGCSASDTVEVVVNPSPGVSLGADTVLCNGASLVLDPGFAGGSYAWSTGDSTSTITVSIAGSYSVAVTDTNGCIGSDDITVTTAATPTASVVANPGGNLTFNFQSNATGSPTSYAWTFGDGGTSTIANPTHTYAAGGTYTVTLVVTNACGTATSTTTLTVVGIQDAMANVIELYPNPAGNEVVLKRKEGACMPQQVYLMDLSGRTLISHDAASIFNGETAQISVSALADGQYIVVVTCEEGKQHIRLTVLR